MIKIADEGNVVIRIATTGGESGDIWTVYPHIKNDPTLQNFGPDDKELIKSLSVSNTDASGNTNLDKKAEAISRLIRNLDDLQDFRLKIESIDTTDPELTSLLGKEYGIKDITVESDRKVTSESKE